MKDIFLVGATGYTGSITLAALEKRNLPCTIVGRNEQKLKHLKKRHANVTEIRVACANDAASLKNAFDGAGVVINTVGPFQQFGIQVLKASIHAGAHYVDSTAEQAFQKSVMETYHRQAQEKNLTILTGHACDFSFSYLGAAILNEVLGPLSQCSSYHELLGFETSRGTAKSALGMISEDFYTYENNQWTQQAPQWRPTQLRFPGDKKRSYAVPFPGGDAILIPNELDSLKHYSAHLLLPKKEAQGFAIFSSLRPIFSPFLTGRVIRFLEKKIDSNLEDPKVENRKKVPWRVVVSGKGPHGQGTCDIRGLDPYGISGETLSIAAQWLAEGKAKTPGVVSTGAAFDPREFLGKLEEHHVSWLLCRKALS